MYLWNILREKGLTFLILRNFNQDPLENLFGQISQHGFASNNPRCHQFIAAFKTLIINNLSSPISSKNNCEDDQCESLGDFSIFLQKYSNKKLNKEIFNDDLFNETSNEELDNFSKNNFATAYVAGYVLKKLKFDECSTCHRNLFSDNIDHKHLFVSFKENDEDARLQYASEKLINYIELINSKLYPFLEKNCHLAGLEDNFRGLYRNIFNEIQFCDNHNLTEPILKIIVPVFIYKYLKGKNATKGKSAGHFRKINIFKEGEGCSKPKKIKLN